MSSATSSDFLDMTLVPGPVPFAPYHVKRQPIKPEDRPFIAWDGEGVNLDGPNFPQSYTLFGCSTGEYVQSDSHLHTFDLLDFIVSIGVANPGAFHIGFAFNYDSNMLVRSLSADTIRRLHKDGRVSLTQKSTGYRFLIRVVPGKWFSVTRYDPEWDAKLNPRAKVTVKIEDIFSFFGTSFIKAYEQIVGPVPDVVVEGKAARNDFDAHSPAYVLKYWQAEIVMLRELAEKLRERMYGANLRIRSWHGPGALASYVNKQHGVKHAMAVCPDAVREAARFAYAGGRFEMFKLGRTVGPIYSLDINSAYPHAIRQLPNLSTGVWGSVGRPTKIARFGVYRVRLLPRPGDSFLERRPGPLFHRDKLGNISFPWVTDGWYWSPEVMNLIKWLPKERYEIIEGWEYTGWNLRNSSSESSSVYPYSWVSEMYALRRLWKKQGNESQLALKLCMNSLYGKMAQRVGWNEEKRTAPPWHQLEWAGWVTSYCRAMLWDAMCKAGPGNTIAVETDGLYTTVPPETILGYGRESGLGDESQSGEYGSSTELGGWEVEKYDEILYVQSGLAFLRKGDKWIVKRRGLDAKSFELDACRDYLHTLGPGGDWLPYVGRTTRFIGMGAALGSNAPFKLRHCVWQTVDREINPGSGGKRVHIWRQCGACSAGYSAWDAGHDMNIRSLAYGDPKSYQHDIPWENGDQGYLHRDVPDEGDLDLYGTDYGNSVEV